MAHGKYTKLKGTHFENFARPGGKNTEIFAELQIFFEHVEMQCVCKLTVVLWHDVNK